MQMVSQSAPLAIYVHCYAHKLYLILVDACKSVLAQVLLCIRISWVEAQNELYHEEPASRLQQLSDTRCLVVSCRNIRGRLHA